jgi:hypothetical protein
VRKLIDQRFGYVAVSRAEMDARVFTDRADVLAATLGRIQDKNQALGAQELKVYSNESISSRVVQKPDITAAAIV